MKISLLNSSPRHNGNTAYATQQLTKSIEEYTTHSIESIKVCDLNVSGCTACDGCIANNGVCVIKDDTQYILDKISEADMVVFLVPVYWWSIPAQLKAVIDKFYSVQSTFKSQQKKIGVITIGANDTSDKQYSLISDQFTCISDFLGWEKIFDLSFCAYERDDLQNSQNSNCQFSSIHQYFI